VKEVSRRRTSGLEQRVLAQFRRRVLSAECRVVVGFSGGADSLGLLVVLAQLATRMSLRIVAVHVDHGARTSSRHEQNEAGVLAAKLGVPFQPVTLPIDPRIAHPRLGFEEAARRERYLALARISRSASPAVIAIGHHLQDQAETVILHLIRGAGASGLMGMSEWTETTIPWWEASPEPPATIWRPFLRESRDTVRTVGLSAGLRPVEDPTNTDLDIRRNAIRERILPKLEAIVPGATAAIGRCAEIVASENDLLNDLTSRAAQQLIHHDLVDRGRLLDQPIAIQRRLIRRWVHDCAGYAAPLNRIDAVLAAARSGTGETTIEIGEHVAVRLIQGRIQISGKNAETPQTSSFPDRLG